MAIHIIIIMIIIIYIVRTYYLKLRSMQNCDNFYFDDENHHGAEIEIINHTVAFILVSCFIEHIYRYKV